MEWSPKQSLSRMWAGRPCRLAQVSGGSPCMFRASVVAVGLHAHPIVVRVRRKQRAMLKGLLIVVGVGLLITSTCLGLISNG